MKIALMNGSPKVKDSGSEVLLQGLKGYLDTSDEIHDFCLRALSPTKETLAQIAACDVLVFAFPLYVDGIPSHMVASLLALEQTITREPAQKRTVYAIANCGFHEGHHNATALKMIEHWCAHAGAEWGQGLGIGAGGMLVGLDSVPMASGPKKNWGTVLRALAQNIDAGTGADTVFVTANFPRFLYKAAAEFGWRRSAKANGLTTKDLFTQRAE